MRVRLHGLRLLRQLIEGAREGCLCAVRCRVAYFCERVGYGCLLEIVLDGLSIAPVYFHVYAHAMLANNFLVDVFFLYYVRLVLCRIQVQFKIMCFFLALDFGPYFGRHAGRQLRVKRNAAYAYALLASRLLQSVKLAAVKQLAEYPRYLLFHYTRSVVAYRN